MKIIRLPSSAFISAFNGPTERITPELVDGIMAPVNANKLAIFTCAATIEGLLEAIITNFFFGGHRDKQMRHHFENWVLQTSWCSFANKRTLVIEIARELGTLKADAISRLDQLLKKTISYRNAFTHGSIATDGRDVQLTYYEGGRRQRIVDNSWLSKIESEMEECHHMLFFLVRGLSFGLPESGDAAQDGPPA